MLGSDIIIVSGENALLVRGALKVDDIFVSLCKT